MTQYSQSIIGWREWLSLPELEVPQIKAKIDTGAQSCALHAEEMKFYKRQHKEFVKFTIFPFQKSHKGEIHAHAEVINYRKIKSSNGKKEERPIIITAIQLGPYCFDAEISLTSRDQMDFKMLIGRRALKKRFLVDSGRSFLLENKSRKLVK